MRVAVSGLGSIGLQHLRAIAAHGGLTATAFDPSPVLRSRAQHAVPCLERTHDTFEALLDDAPSALIVAGPDRVHIPQTVAAHSAGIPVLVEKPVSDSLEMAERARTELGGGAPVLVGYVLRHWPLLRRTADILASGAIGRPVSAQVAVGAYRTITVAANRFAVPEEGRLYRDYSHEWDYLRWFFGTPRRVFATERTVTTVPHVESPNAVDGLIDLGPVLASFHIDYVDPAGLRQVTILGSGGNLTLDAGRGRLRHQTDNGDVIEEQHLPVPGEGLLRQVGHLVSVASGDAVPAVTWADGVAALSCAEALRRSAASGRWEEVRDGAAGPSDQSEGLGSP